MTWHFVWQESVSFVSDKIKDRVCDLSRSVMHVCLMSAIFLLFSKFFFVQVLLKP